MGEVIDGKAFAANLRAAVGRQAAALKAAHGLVPGLAVVLIGEDPASQVYVRHKVQATVEAGMESFRTDLPADTSEEAMLEVVARLNARTEERRVGTGSGSTGRSRWGHDT